MAKVQVSPDFYNTKFFYFYKDFYNTKSIIKSREEASLLSRSV